MNLIKVIILLLIIIIIIVLFCFNLKSICMT